MNDSIGQTIYQQLGGGRFAVMTGAKCLTTEHGLMIKLGRGSKVSAFEVVLTPADTYTIKTYTGRTYTPGATIEDVYADRLCAVFESETGLYTSL